MDEIKFKKRSHKKSKKKHKKHVSSDSSNSDSDNLEWVEAKTSDKQPTSNKRDEWMGEEDFVPTFSKNAATSSRSKKQMETERLADINKEIQNQRELNPYWKDNGKGVPDKEVDSSSLSLPSTSVGDGGYGWLKKAYRRIQEQSRRDGRSMEEIAVERWGSLDKLVSMIEEAESRMKSQSLSSVRVKHRIEEPEREPLKMRRPDDHYKEESWNSSYHGSSSKFKKPQVDDSFDSSYGSESSKSNKSHHKDYREEKYDSHRSHMPSWKKQKPKESSDEQDKYDSPRAHVPSWKKPKPKESLQEQDLKRNQETSTQKVVGPQLMSKPEDPVKQDESSDEEIFMTEQEITKLSTRYHKADLMGNTELANKLKAQLDRAKKLPPGTSRISEQSNRTPQNVVLSKIDSSGQSRPLYLEHSEDDLPRKNVRQSNKNKYFDEDSKYSLKQMFEREKLTTVDDHLQMFLEVASESKNPEDQDYDCDDVSKKFSKKMSHRHQESKDIGTAIQQHQRLSSALEKCQYCLDQPNMKRHLIISIGVQAYLCLPPFQSIVDGHCLIVPKNHVSSFLYLDEDECLDIKNFKEGLRKMFLSEEKNVIFIETSINFRSCPHAIVECIPVPKDSSDLAPFYFKKAIQESEGEWCHNKKLIDLTNKGLRSSVPKELPYFCVEFDPEVHRGYAHVIEDEKYFPRNFGKEVIGGMLDIDYNFLYKNRKEDPIKKSKEVVAFEKRWNICNPA